MSRANPLIWLGASKKMKEKTLEIKKIVEELLMVADFESDVAIQEEGDGFLVVNIQSVDAPYLIGHAGINLGALQQIIRLIVVKKLIEAPRFMIDVNHYQKNRLEFLKQTARDLTREAIMQKTTRRLEPMNAYERRIVHMCLAEIPGIKTESEGEGEERRVVIKPVNG